MSLEDQAIKGAMTLAAKIADAISQKLGTNAAMTFDIAKRVAAEYVELERRAVTDARKEALAKANAAGRVSRNTDSEK